MDHQTSLTALYDFGRDCYAAASLSVLGFEGEIRYAGFGGQDVPANDKYWARVSRRVVEERQETLRNGLLERRFVSNGLVFVQLFCPIIDSTALLKMNQIAELLRNDFRLYQGAELEFTSPAIADNIAPEPNWLRANIVSNYAYRQFIS